MTTRAIRVLMISTQPFFQWRGSPIRVKFNLLALESLGMHVDLLTMPYGEDEPAVRSTIHRVARLPGVRDIPIGPSFAKFVLNFLILGKAFLLAVRHRFDVIHATEEAGVTAWMVGRATGARCIYEKHSDPASYQKPGLRRIVMKVYALLEAFTARRSDAVICTGPGLEAQVREYAPHASVYSIADIPSSLVEPDEEECRRLATQLRAHPDEVIVTYVGSFALYQGIDLLFDTIPKVVEQYPQARFLIIGGSDEEIAHYKDQLGAAAGHVNFAGRIAPDLLPIHLGASDILLAPRRVGINTPLKVLDYFKAGGAIVATDTPANRLILDHDCARLSRFDKEDFAAAIGALIADPVKRAQIAAEGHRRYRTRYNFTEFRSQLANVYRGVLHERRGLDAIPD